MIAADASYATNNYGFLVIKQTIPRDRLPTIAYASPKRYTHAFYRTNETEEYSMANSAQARKRARQNVKGRGHNASLRSRLRTAIKAVQKAVLSGDKTAAQSVYRTSTSTIDSIADKRIIHKNKAARHKSRLSAAIKSMAA